MLWNTIKTSLHNALPENEFGLWIKPLECRRQDDQGLELVGPDRFFCAWVEDRYLDLIRKKAEELGMIADVRLQVADNRPPSSTDPGPASSACPEQPVGPACDLSTPPSPLSNSWLASPTSWPAPPARPWPQATPPSATACS
jgi:chromosomal replication initiation ATPase DnaA